MKAVGRRSLEIPGTAAKVDLERELSQALARSDAAARAADGVRSEVAEAARKLASVESEITLAVAAIALEEMATIADAARGAMATIAEARVKGLALDRILGDFAGRDSPVFTAALVAAGESLKNSFDLPRVSEPAERYIEGTRKAVHFRRRITRWCPDDNAVREPIIQCGNLTNLKIEPIQPGVTRRTGQTTQLGSKLVASFCHEQLLP